MTDSIRRAKTEDKDVSIQLNEVVHAGTASVRPPLLTYTIDAYIHPQTSNVLKLPTIAHFPFSLTILFQLSWKKKMLFFCGWLSHGLPELEMYFLAVMPTIGPLLV